MAVNNCLADGCAQKVCASLVGYVGDEPTGVGVCVEHVGMLHSAATSIAKIIEGQVMLDVLGVRNER